MEVVVFEDGMEYSDLCEKYWELDDLGKFKWTVSALAKEYSVPYHHIHKIVKANSIAYSSRIGCDTCQEPYEYDSRNDYNSVPLNIHWICDDCRDIMKSMEERAKREMLQILWDDSAKRAYSLEDLSVRHAVFLMALIRYSGSEDLQYLNAFRENKTDVFSPDLDYSGEIIVELARKNIIAVSPETSLDSVRYNEDGSLSRNFGMVRWALPLNPQEGGPISFTENLERKLNTQDFLTESCKEVISLCKEISLRECIAYLKFTLNEHQLSFSPGEKTNLVLNKALEHFSVSQVCSFIWRASKDAVAFYVRSGTQKRHAANTVVGNIDKQIERALANSWQVPSFKRRYEMPQSEVSRVLFNTLLRTDDGGFNQLLKDILPEPA
ncbi:conserved hypothetical protein [Hahella chejuensis KCTC 2396]|uniref:Uncharacterized protein n=1 Tax=Hahella chejuensis (strain KCTC 2396) TaxID=349521 RepID=Q2SAN6_HAHCH|nr:hypothetical protein [Hahella chejuensis]ABC32288.1 conserved hypothetical protein [Hahella chejuensis KCTC 2396]